MVKTKGGRALNPADAFRKEQRKKEVQRNKMERKFIREGAKMRSDPESLKKELQELIDMEESATLPKNLKLKKKALQEAYDQALKRKKVRHGGVGRGQVGWGLAGRSPGRRDCSPADLIGKRLVLEAWRRAHHWHDPGLGLACGPMHVRRSAHGGGVRCACENAAGGHLHLLRASLIPRTQTQPPQTRARTGGGDSGQERRAAGGSAGRCGRPCGPTA